MENIQSCLYCKYCDENYHEYKDFCVYHDFWIHDYNVCSEYEI